MLRLRILLLFAVLSASGLMFQLPLFPAIGAHADTPLTVTGVARNNSSVKVFYGAVPGARDYRIYDVAEPTVVKYAGLVHLVAPPGQHFVTVLRRYHGSLPVWDRFNRYRAAGV